MDQSSAWSNLNDAGLQLSPRQVDCLALVAEGLTSKDIARRLSLSPSTVDSHIAAAVRLLGCTTRAEAVRRLRMRGRIPSEVVRAPGIIPPLGGRPNDSAIARRIRDIAVITILAIAFSAVGIAAIVGTVAILQR